MCIHGGVTQSLADTPASNSTCSAPGVPARWNQIED
jgi:hypothetical protein